MRAFLPVRIPGVWLADPVALGVRAGAPLPPGDVVPGVVDPEVGPPPEDEVPDEVCASAAVAVKLSANVATIAVLMDGQRCNHGIVPMGRHAFAPALSAAVQSTPAPIFAN